MTKREILILEDDRLFAQTLEDFLEEMGYSVTLAYDANEALVKKYFHNYDLCIFDINVPYQNGIDLYVSLKESGDMTPTIFVTSYKDTETLKKCFTHGCHDYLKKPIDLDELHCRIENIFRYMSPCGERVVLSEYCYFDTLTRTLYENDQAVKVPRKIILLLELFIANANKIVTKNQIIDCLWSSSDEFSEGAIRVYINKLKKYMKRDSLVSIKGLGYKFMA
jgi:DNA-binding response OmpR family regulator